MRYAAIAIGVVVLAGCQSVEELRALAPRQSDYEICRAVMAGGRNMQQVAWEEQQRRGLNCEGYANAIAAQQGANNALAMQLLQQSRQAPPPMLPMPQAPRQVNCTSYRYGNQVQTTCN